MLRTLLIPALAMALAMSPCYAQKRAAGAAAPKSRPMKAPKQERPIEKFQNMSPAEREKALAKLPPARRQAIEQRLQQYNRLTPDEKARLQRFASLPPERQQAVRKAYNGVTKLPAGRQQAVRDELRQMRGLSPAERESHVNSEEFRGKFSPHEQKLIDELRDVPQ